MDERVKILAHNLVNYSMKVQKDNKVYIQSFGESTQDLVRLLVKEVYLAGGIPFPHYIDQRVQRETLLHCSEEQMTLMAKIDAAEMDQMDCYVGVRGTDNVSELADVPSEKMALYEKFYATPVHHDIRVKKTRWVVLRYPNNAMAQLANTSLENFEEFYFNVCNLDYSKMKSAMVNLVDFMDRTDNVKILGPGSASS